MYLYLPIYLSFFLYIYLCLSISLYICLSLKVSLIKIMFRFWFGTTVSYIRGSWFAWPHCTHSRTVSLINNKEDSIQTGINQSLLYATINLQLYQPNNHVLWPKSRFNSTLELIYLYIEQRRTGQDCSEKIGGQPARDHQNIKTHNNAQLFQQHVHTSIITSTITSDKGYCLSSKSRSR